MNERINKPMESVGVVIQRQGYTYVIEGDVDYRLNLGDNLYAVPVDAKAIRAEALEEAKKACDEICQKAIDSGYTVKGETFIDGFGDGACACAAAIGGLK